MLFLVRFDRICFDHMKNFIYSLFADVIVSTSSGCSINHPVAKDYGGYLEKTGVKPYISHAINHFQKSVLIQNSNR